MWQWLVISAALVCGVIPQFGVLAVPALVLASQRLLQLPLSRRNQLALLGMGLPTPLACIAPLWGTQAWWQRLLCVGALALAWSPLPPQLVWGGVLLVAGVPLLLTPTRDALRWLMPVLVVASRMAWPMWWDVAGVVVAASCYAVGALQHRPALQWWSAALLCVAVASGAGIIVLPWVCLLHSMPVAQQRGLSIVAWWGMAGMMLSAGLWWGIGLFVFPLVQALGQVTWQDMRRHALVMVLWLAVPLTGSVARLQTSLGAYGDVVNTTSWQFVDAAHAMVAGVPWLVVGWCLGLAWAMRQLWDNEVAHE